MKPTTNMDHVPAHVRAAWTPEERAYYETVYDEPRPGLEWLTAHRKIEMAVADVARREFFLGYWPDDALASLESFKARHYDALPDTGYYAESSVVNRLRHHYPDLFANMDHRMGALREAAATHPYLLVYAQEYERLKATYFRKLKAAEELAGSGSGLKQSQQKRINKQKHEYFRAAFIAIYPNLRSLLLALVALRR